MAEAPHPRYYSPYDAIMWESIAKGEMRIQRCSSCGTFRYPPGACCPNCLSVEATWEKVSGDAKIVSWATYHKQYLPAYPAPHTVVVTQLAEGPLFVSNIDQSEAGKLALDKPLKIVYGDHPDGYKIPRVTIAEG